MKGGGRDSDLHVIHRRQLTEDGRAIQDGHVVGIVMFSACAVDVRGSAEPELALGLSETVEIRLGDC